MTLININEFNRNGNRITVKTQGSYISAGIEGSIAIVEVDNDSKVGIGMTKKPGSRLILAISSPPESTDCNCSNNCVTFDDGVHTGFATILNGPCVDGYPVYTSGVIRVFGSGLYYLDGRWKIDNVSNLVGEWAGIYLGPEAACPDGIYTVEVDQSGSPPATITVTSGACA